MASLSSSAWRTMRGEPHAGQRALSSGASARQSRQRLGMIANGKDSLAWRSR
jgi:hypothetical protein